MREHDADQAAGLRAMFGRSAARAACVIDTAQNGATCVSVSLAGALANLGSRVLVLDASAGDAARAIGQPARYELAHVLAGDKSIAEVLLRGGDDICVLPARRALARLDDAPYPWREAVHAALGAQRFDAWLVNGTAATLEHEPALLAV